MPRPRLRRELLSVGPDQAEHGRKEPALLCSRCQNRNLDYLTAVCKYGFAYGSFENPPPSGSIPLVIIKISRRSALSEAGMSPSWIHQHMSGPNPAIAFDRTHRPGYDCRGKACRSHSAGRKPAGTNREHTAHCCSFSERPGVRSDDVQWSA
jgi:hypothetical protein